MNTRRFFWGTILGIPIAIFLIFIFSHLFNNSNRQVEKKVTKTEVDSLYKYEPSIENLQFDIELFQGQIDQYRGLRTECWKSFKSKKLSREEASTIINSYNDEISRYKGLIKRNIKEVDSIYHASKIAGK